MAETPAEDSPQASRKKEVRRAASRQRERLAQLADGAAFEGLSKSVFTILEAREGRETIAAYWPLGRGLGH